MHYGRLGMVGYALNVVVFSATAAFLAIGSSLSFVIQGFDLPAFLTPLPGLLISLAWWKIGGDRQSGLFRATGVIGFLFFLASLSAAVWSGLYPSPAGVQPSSPAQLRALIGALASVAGLLAITFFVLESVSFFSAGKALQNRLLRYAGWSRIFVLVGGGALLLVAIVYGLLSYLPSIGGGRFPGPRAGPAQPDADGRV